jgi:hypothetical protein
MRKKFWKQKAWQVTELHKVVEEEEDLEIPKAEPQRLLPCVIIDNDNDNDEGYIEKSCRFMGSKVSLGYMSLVFQGSSQIASLSNNNFRPRYVC